MTGQRFGAVLAAWLVCGGAALAAPAGGLPARHVLPVELALEAARTALAACAAQGYRVAVAVVDRKGAVEVLAADPDVSPVSVELSQRKARTAALFNARSGEVGQRFQANPGFGQAMNGVDPRLSGAQGAVPIAVEGELVGAMGISGAPGGDKDEACVQAGLAAVADRLRF
jgi:uncharacterized protein GlcG (DUF336 family)